MDTTRPLAHELSRRRLITLAGAAALGAALAPGTFRLLESPAPLELPTVVPPGFRSLDSPEFAIRMAIPDDLVTVRPWDLLKEDGVLAGFEDLTRRVAPVTHESLDDQLNSIDILAIADDGTCVNVMRVTSDTVPTPAMLAAEVEAMQLTEVVFGQTDTVLGPSTTMRSNTPMLDGKLMVPGYVLWARNPRGVFSVQVTAASEDVVEALYAIILRSLQPFPR